MELTIQEAKQKLDTTKRDNVHVSEDGTVVNMLSVRQIRDFLLMLGVSYDYIIIRVGDTVTSSDKGLEWSVKSYNTQNPIAGVIISMSSKIMDRKKYIAIHDMAITQEDINKAQDIVGFYVSVALSRVLRGTIYEFLDTPIIGTNPTGNTQSFEPSVKVEEAAEYSTEKQVEDNREEEPLTLDLLDTDGGNKEVKKKKVSKQVSSMLDLLD